MVQTRLLFLQLVLAVDLAALKQTVILVALVVAVVAGLLLLMLVALEL
jgi:hypothetical protein